MSHHVLVLDYVPTELTLNSVIRSFFYMCAELWKFEIDIENDGVDMFIAYNSMYVGMHHKSDLWFAFPHIFA